MEYKAETTVTREFVNSSPIADEVIFRDIIREMIDDIQLEELGKLFRLNIIDPESEESKSKMKDRLTSDQERQRILKLKYHNVLLYEVVLGLKG